MLFSILKNADIARTKRRPAFTSRNHLSSHLSVCHPTYNPYDPIFLIVRPAFGAHQRWMGGWVRGKGKQLRTLSGIAWPWDGLNGYSLIVELNVGQPSPAEIISALTSQSAIPRTTPTIPFSSLSAPLLELTNVGWVDGLEEKANSRKLYRSRDGCGSVILRAGLGR
nr:hypothetical protein L203_03711 [Cryptococcus depauperatus CBS 7841]